MLSMSHSVHTGSTCATRLRVTRRVTSRAATSPPPYVLVARPQRAVTDPACARCRGHLDRLDDPAGGGVAQRGPVRVGELGHREAVAEPPPAAQCGGQAAADLVDRP